MDILTEQQRSWNMSRIRSKNTKPEIIVRRYLYSKGLRYRIHANLPGKPDLVFRQRKIVVFVNGCFWHGHEGCKDFSIPKTRSDFWQEKIGKNISRDKKNYEILKNEGWRVLRIWECELGKDKMPNLERLYKNLVSEDSKG